VAEDLLAELQLDEQLELGRDEPGDVAQRERERLVRAGDLHVAAGRALGRRAGAGVVEPAGAGARPDPVEDALRERVVDRIAGEEDQVAAYRRFLLAFLTGVSRSFQVQVVAHEPVPK